MWRQLNAIFWVVVFLTEIPQFYWETKVSPCMCVQGIHCLHNCSRLRQCVIDCCCTRWFSTQGVTNARAMSL